MRTKNIKTLVASAEELIHLGDRVSAFALYWIAYEGLCFRAAVKALWLRGCTVKDAEAFLISHRIHDPFKLIESTVGKDLKKGRVPIIRLFKRLYSIRTNLLHKAVIDKKQIDLILEALRITLADPACLFDGLTIQAQGARGRTLVVPLGNPLTRLSRARKDKPGSRLPVKLVNMAHFKPVPAIPKGELLTEDVLLDTFVRDNSVQTNAPKPFLVGNKSLITPLTATEKALRDDVVKASRTK